jgi:hypothetical protein
MKAEVGGSADNNDCSLLSTSTSHLYTLEMGTEMLLLYWRENFSLR